MADDGERPNGGTLAGIVQDVIGPLVARDLGEIEWLGVVDGIAEVSLRGACAGCPGQSYTLNDVILPALRAADASIRSVRARNRPRG